MSRTCSRKQSSEAACAVQEVGAGFRDEERQDVDEAYAQQGELVQLLPCAAELGCSSSHERRCREARRSLEQWIQLWVHGRVAKADRAVPAIKTGSSFAERLKHSAPVC